MQTSLLFTTALIGGMSVFAAPAAEPGTLEARAGNSIVGFTDANFKGTAFAYQYNYQACFVVPSPGNRQLSSLSLGSSQQCLIYQANNCNGAFFDTRGNVADLSKVNYSNGVSANDNVGSFLCIAS